MFTRLGPNSAQSTDGFRVERIGRMELKYSEGSRSVTVEVEPGDGLAIYRGTITSWNPPHNDDSLTGEDMARIIRNICAALEFLGTEYVLA